jgi:hypothetical protein
MWSLHGRADSASSSCPTSRWRLEWTLYHHLLLPPLFDRAFFHTPQPLTGQRDCRGSVICAILCDTTPLTQHVGDSTSNNYVLVLNLSLPILPSPPAAAQQKTYIDVPMQWCEDVIVCIQYDIS